MADRANAAGPWTICGPALIAQQLLAVLSQQPRACLFTMPPSTSNRLTRQCQMHLLALYSSRQLLSLQLMRQRYQSMPQMRRAYGQQTRTQVQ